MSEATFYRANATNELTNNILLYPMTTCRVDTKRHLDKLQKAVYTLTKYNQVKGIFQVPA